MASKFVAVAADRVAAKLFVVVALHLFEVLARYTDWQQFVHGAKVGAAVGAVVGAGAAVGGAAVGAPVGGAAVGAALGGAAVGGGVGTAVQQPRMRLEDDPHVAVRLAVAPVQDVARVSSLIAEAAALLVYPVGHAAMAPESAKTKTRAREDDMLGFVCSLRHTG